MAGERWDVAVVGAGPAGSHCAAQLAARGYRVLLLDENEAAREEILCTGIIGADGFTRLGLPISSVVATLKTARFISPSGSALVYRPEQPFAYVVGRQRFDRALQRRAVEARAELCFGFYAEQREWVPGGIRIHGWRGDEPYAVEARVAVFATGFHRGLGRALSLGEPHGFIQAAQLVATVRDLDGAEVYFGREITPGFFAWVVPIGADRARVGLLARGPARKWLERFLDGPHLRDRLGERLTPISSRPIVQGALPRTAGDHFLVVGEAAGQVKTSTAGGIYYGLLCAELAATVIDEAFRNDDLSEQRLGDYHRRWLRLLGPELRAGFRLQRLGALLSDEEIDELFEIIATDGLLDELERRVQFDWHRPVILFLLRHLLLAGRFLKTFA